MDKPDVRVVVPLPRFTLDGLLGQPDAPTWSAVRYGSNWNGWATPVVNRAVLAEILEFIRGATGEPHGWDGPAALVSGPVEDGGEPEYVDCMEPAEDGTYDLGGLGWTWVQVSS